MHDLTPQNALGGARPKRDEIGALTITENPDVALASVAARQGQETACRKMLKEVMGQEAPLAGKAVLGGDMSALWIAADQWMLYASHTSHEDLAAELVKALGGLASITEQSDAWVCFDVEGPTVVDLCERLCAVPSRRLQSGDAHRTSLHHMGCLLVCLETGRHFRFMGPRSSAESLHHALTATAKSIL